MTQTKGATAFDLDIKVNTKETVTMILCMVIRKVKSFIILLIWTAVSVRKKKFLIDLIPLKYIIFICVCM